MIKVSCKGYNGPGKLAIPPRNPPLRLLPEADHADLGRSLRMSLWTLFNTNYSCRVYP